MFMPKNTYLFTKDTYLFSSIYLGYQELYDCVT
jgi:hypothetical protein